MKFIVSPKKSKKGGGGQNTTMCALCSEDPRFCGDPI